MRGETERTTQYGGSNDWTVVGEDIDEHGLVDSILFTLR